MLRGNPIEPFRIHLTGGTTFEVRHPDVAIVGATTVRIDLPAGGDQERRAYVSLIHIVWVEIIAPIP